MFLNWSNQYLLSILNLILFPFILTWNGPETVKLIPEHLVTYKVFGEPKGPHYAHYDLVGGRLVCKSFSILLPFGRWYITYLKIYFPYLCTHFHDLSSKMQAVEQVYPCIAQFLSSHDQLLSS